MASSNFLMIHTALQKVQFYAPLYTLANWMLMVIGVFKAFEAIYCKPCLYILDKVWGTRCVPQCYEYSHVFPNHDLLFPLQQIPLCNVVQIMAFKPPRNWPYLPLKSITIKLGPIP